MVGKALLPGARSNRCRARALGSTNFRVLCWCFAICRLAACAPAWRPGGCPYAAAKGSLTPLRALGPTNFRVLCC